MERQVPSFLNNTFCIRFPRVQHPPHHQAPARPPPFLFILLFPPSPSPPFPPPSFSFSTLNPREQRFPHPSMKRELSVGTSIKADIDYRAEVLPKRDPV